MSRHYAFETVDVFTPTRFAGNQLAVLPDARGLSPAEMQAIAAEFGYAETAFVLPPDDPAHTMRVRIFTPTLEMPFAGHPNVGTAFLLARAGRPEPEFRFEEIAGLVHAWPTFAPDGTVTGASVRAPAALAIGATVDPTAVAALAALSPADIRTQAHAPCFASVGAEFLCAEVAPAALARARPDAAAFAAAGALGGRGDFLGLCLYTIDGDQGEIRMFAPTAGVVEDPATGSAAAALGGFRHHLDPGLTHLRLVQGRFVGRPSTIEVTMAPGDIRIGGFCVAVMQGTLTL